nr:2752_t:CDS:2 [Entrophospora candida]
MLILKLDEAIEFLKDKRKDKINGCKSDEVLGKIVSECISGRILYLDKLAKETDVDLFDYVIFKEIIKSSNFNQILKKVKQRLEEADENQE